MRSSTEVATVFGGSGFIGRYVVQRLAAQGHVVRVAVRDPEGAAFQRPMGTPGQVVPVAANVTDAASVARAVAGAHQVVSLVGILYETRSARFDTVQAKAPGLIGAACAAAGVEALVHVSAIGADPASESLYARSKAVGEAALLAAFPQATVLRPSLVFGAEDGFFNRFGQLASLLPALPLFGGGTTKFQPVFVGDVADAVLAALGRLEARGKTYELGGPRVWTFRELMEYVLRETRRKRLLLDLPWSVAMLQGRLGELLPVPPITRDQVLLLQQDNVVAPGALGLADLGIQPAAIEAIVPSYLARFRSGGGRKEQAPA